MLNTYSHIVKVLKAYSQFSPCDVFIGPQLVVSVYGYDVFGRDVKGIFILLKTTYSHF